MNGYFIFLVALIAVIDYAGASEKLKIGIKKRVENCTVKTRKGDLVHMHYTVNGSLAGSNATLLHASNRVFNEG